MCKHFHDMPDFICLEAAIGHLGARSPRQFGNATLAIRNRERRDVADLLKKEG